MLHTLRFELKGSSSLFVKGSELQLDIADVFKRLACTLGFEDPRSSYSQVLALWQTPYLYNDTSLLDEDFLSRGLHLDLLCDAAQPIPFAEIFLCLQESLCQVATCKVSEISLLLEPYSLKLNKRKVRRNGNLSEFVRLTRNAAPTPFGNFTTLKYNHVGALGEELASSTLQLPARQYHLADAALPFIALWSGRLRNVVRRNDKVHISFT